MSGPLLPTPFTVENSLVFPKVSSVSQISSLFLHCTQMSLDDSQVALATSWQLTSF